MAAVKKKTPDPSGKSLPVTRVQLELTKKELMAGIRSLDYKIDAVRDKLVAKLDSRIGMVESRIGGVESKIEKVHSEVARIGVLVEQQTSNNRLVLEHLSILYGRQDRVEKTVEDMNQTLLHLKNFAKR